jgi:arginyl-tRNA synthetase
LGYSAIADVHLGDWGLPMGIVLGELLDREPGLSTMNPQAIASEWVPPTIDDLNEVYPAGSAKCRSDPELMTRARALTAQLQAGDENLTAIWRRIVAISVAASERDFARLNVRFDLWQGESHAQDKLTGLIASARQQGVAETSEGALVIRLPKADGTDDLPPLILEKSQGGVMYAGTDLATIADRVETLAPDSILYIVDQRQHLHFEQVFRAAECLGLVTKQRPHLEHVGFGTINGLDGKPLKTRTGGVLRLSDLQDQVVAVCQQRCLELTAVHSPQELEQVAERLAVAVIRFADLSNNRRSDYIFNVERFSELEGRTGPYLCYVLARATAILRKADEAGRIPGAIAALETPIEQALALRLLAFPDVIASAYEKRLPNLLCDHLFDLGQKFNSFYNQVHVLSETDRNRQGAMLGLVAVVAAQMRLGLSLLGIDPPERM